MTRALSDTLNELIVLAEDVITRPQALRSPVARRQAVNLVAPVGFELHQGARQGRAAGVAESVAGEVDAAHDPQHRAGDRAFLPVPLSLRRLRPATTDETWRPTCVEPVKEMSGRRGSFSIASPTVRSRPHGMPAGARSMFQVNVAALCPPDGGRVADGARLVEEERRGTLFYLESQKGRDTDPDPLLARLIAEIGEGCHHNGGTP